MEPRRPCATDEERLRPGLGALLESLIGRLAIQTTMRSMVVVEVFPFFELVVEDLGVVDHHPVEHPVELLLVDAMGALHLAVETGGGGFDVDVSDPPVQDVVVELGAELDPVEFLTGCQGLSRGSCCGGTGGVLERYATPFLTRSSLLGLFGMLATARRASRISGEIWWRSATIWRPSAGLIGVPSTSRSW